MVSQEDIERLRELLARPAQNIVIVSHTNPDGDAVGSSLAWREALLEMGHRVTCIVPNKYPYFLDWMTGIENLVLFKTDEAGVARRAVEESDLIFFLDFNAVSRLEGLSEVIESNTTARRILIDHHLSPGPGFDLMFSCTGSSSTSFLIYRILEKMLGTQAITRSMAESLYVGMMTDTGNFSFSFLTPELYRAVAVLVETGIDIPTIRGPCPAVRLCDQPQDGGDPQRYGRLYVASGERDAPVSVPARRQRGVRELSPDDQVDEAVGDLRCHA